MNGTGGGKGKCYIDAGFMGSGSFIIFAGGVGRGSTVVLNVAIL